tara:strand:+ start:128 stop:292 length:165 start_codon:yes stop_codon:yes gene_type:complete
LTNDAGAKAAFSSGRELLAFLYGHGGIIRGLEAKFSNREVGDAFTASIEPEQAY